MILLYRLLTLGWSQKHKSRWRCVKDQKDEDNGKTWEAVPYILHRVNPSRFEIQKYILGAKDI
jgi:hypothetical protein